MLTKRNKGFTLQEVLVAVAIIVVLLAIAIPSVLTITKNLKMNELDSAARQIFIASQNNLSLKKTSGALSGLSWSPAVPQIPSFVTQSDEYLNMSAADRAVYLASIRYLDKASASALLPSGSLLAEVFDNHFIIEFSVQTGQVISVFYSDKPFNYSGDFASAEFRAYSSRSAHQPKLGYYGSTTGGSDIVVDETPMPTILLVNDMELHLDIEVNASTEYTVTIKGMNTGVTQSFGFSTDAIGGLNSSLPNISLNGTTIKFVIDGLEDGRHFCDLLPAHTPGEDIKVEVKAQYVGSGYILGSTLPAYATAQDNSIFASVDSGIGNIFNARHFQNISAPVSGITDFVTSFRQTSDIDWQSQTSVPFKAVVNGFMIEYNGNGNRLNTFICNPVTVSGVSYNGIFGKLNSPIVSNIYITNEKQNGDATYSGGLVGFANSITVKSCGIYLDLPDYTAMNGYQITGSNNVGGLIGRAEISATVSDSFSAVGGIVISGSGNVGGLIGSAAECDIKHSYANCYVSELSYFGIYISGGTTVYAGGLVGYAQSGDAENDISTCYALCNIGRSAGVDVQGGGFLGYASGVTMRAVYSAATADSGMSFDSFGKTLVSSSVVSGYALDIDDYSTMVPGVSEKSMEQLQAIAATDSNFTSANGWQTANDASTNQYTLAEGLYYPFLKVSGLVHYGDWPIIMTMEQVDFAYYEIYIEQDGSYSLGLYRNETGLSTLNNSKTVFQDGYVFLSNIKNNSLQISVLNGVPLDGNQKKDFIDITKDGLFNGKQLSYNGTVIGPDNSVEILGKTYSLRAMPASVIVNGATTDGVCQTFTMKFSGNVFTYAYTPNFAKSRILSSDSKSISVPDGYFGTEYSPLYLRTVRHYTTLTQTKQIWDIGKYLMQDRDISFATDAYCNYSGRYSYFDSTVDTTYIKNPARIGYDTGNAFSGTYNGSGCELKGITLSGAETSNYALFGYIRTAEINNLKLKNINVTGGSGVAALCGTVQNSVIRNITVDGCTVTGISSTGLIAGSFNTQNGNTALIIDGITVTSNNTVKGERQTGGIAGYVQVNKECEFRIQGIDISGSFSVINGTGRSMGGTVGDAWSSGGGLIAGGLNITVKCPVAYIGDINAHAAGYGDISLAINSYTSSNGINSYLGGMVCGYINATGDNTFIELDNIRFAKAAMSVYDGGAANDDGSNTGSCSDFGGAVGLVNLNTAASQTKTGTVLRIGSLEYTDCNVSSVNSANVSASVYSGLLGRVYGSGSVEMKNSRLVLPSVTANSLGSAYVGGVIGRIGTNSLIINTSGVISITVGDIIGNNGYTGGFVSSLPAVNMTLGGNISLATGKLYGDSYVGGFSAYSVAKALVTEGNYSGSHGFISSGKSAGGFIAFIDNESSAVNTGSITITAGDISGNEYAGGYIANASINTAGSFNNISVSAGNISASGNGGAAGGLFGIYNTPSNMYVSSYNSITVSVSGNISGGKYAGGLYGRDRNEVMGAISPIGSMTDLSVSVSGDITGNCTTGVAGISGMLRLQSGSGTLDNVTVTVGGNIVNNGGTASGLACNVNVEGGTLGYIKNSSVTVTGTIKGRGNSNDQAERSRMGGFVGSLFAEADNCTVSARLESTDAIYVGGFAGVTQRSVTNCTVNNSSITTTGNAQYVGGFIGSITTRSKQQNTVSGNMAVNTVVDTQAEYTGGFAAITTEYTNIFDCAVIGQNTTNNAQVDAVGGFMPDIAYPVSGCYVSGGKVTANKATNVGGFAGTINNTLTDCYTDNLTVASANAVNLGGFTGMSSVDISGLYCNNIRVESTNASNDANIGGFIGSVVNITVINCDVRTEADVEKAISNIYIISANGGNVGGFAGAASKGVAIKNCFAAVPVNGGANTGGFVGKLSGGKVSSCYASCDVSGNINAGGFAGYVLRDAEIPSISSSFSTGDVSGSSCNGGFVGRLQSGTAFSCYSLGKVTREPQGLAGGFIGYASTTVNAGESDDNRKIEDILSLYNILNSVLVTERDGLQEQHKPVTKTDDEGNEYIDYSGCLTFYEYLFTYFPKTAFDMDMFANVSGSLVNNIYTSVNEYPDNYLKIKNWILMWDGSKNQLSAIWTYYQDPTTGKIIHYNTTNVGSKPSVIVYLYNFMTGVYEKGTAKLTTQKYNNSNNKYVVIVESAKSGEEHSYNTSEILSISDAVSLFKSAYLYNNSNVSGEAHNKSLQMVGNISDANTFGLAKWKYSDFQNELATQEKDKTFSGMYYCAMTHKYGIGIAEYPYPSLVDAGAGNDYPAFWGKWPNASSTVANNSGYMLYYENYADGSAGYYLKGTLNTLTDKSVLKSGYCYAYTDGSKSGVNAIYLAGSNKTKATSFKVMKNGGKLVININGKDCTLYEVTALNTYPLGFYTTVTINGVKYHYNLDFAKTVVSQSSVPAVNNVYIRTAEQFNRINTYEAKPYAINYIIDRDLVLGSSFTPINGLKAGNTLSGEYKEGTATRARTVYASENYPLFSVLSVNNGKIKRICINYSSGATTFAGFIHTNNGTISYCSVIKANIIASENIGGFIYQNNGVVTDSSISGSVEAVNGNAAGFIYQSAVGSSVMGCGANTLMVKAGKTAAGMIYENYATIQAGTAQSISVSGLQAAGVIAVNNDSVMGFTIVDSVINGSSAAAGFVLENRKAIMDSVVQSTEISAPVMAGFVHTNAVTGNVLNGKVNGCTLSYDSDTYISAHGFVHTNNGKITNSSVKNTDIILNGSNVSPAPIIHVSGFAGVSNGSIIGSSVSETDITVAFVSGSGESYCFGFVESNYADIKNSGITGGVITAQSGGSIAGFAGTNHNDASITGCTASSVILTGGAEYYSFCVKNNGSIA